MTHEAQVFMEDDIRRWGWTCITPDCGANATGYDGLAEAEVGAAAHGAAS